ncbi:MAG: tRNA guanosine(15) transglycosylase TgtA [Candidatus Diapherotrites archaeon]|nr:tRNA guanosine(15) transglycosylase TgtA [Candidatus Diapherotrites archaeon]
MELKLRSRDGAGRLMEVKLNSGRKMITPTFFPVINPHLLYIAPEEISRDFGWNEIITNAYIIWRDPKLHHIAVEKGVHGLLNFDGVVMMDSGAYQMWNYGRLEVSNEEIIEFQNQIKPDIGTFHDSIVSEEAPYEEAVEAVKKTLLNAQVCKELGSEEISWMATVQGSVYEDVVRSAAEALREMDFDYYALGGLVSGASRWHYKKFVDFAVHSLSILPRDRPVHGWGIGHPAVFSLFVLMGIDTFDSASYALYAKDDRLIFPWGTERLQDLEEIPYTLPELRKYSVKELLDLPKEERTRLLARHNLWMILEEMRAIREALRGEYLFEYVQERVRTHPGVYEAYRYLLEKYWKFLEEFTPFSKKHGLFVVADDFRLRPEVRRAKEMLKRVKSNKHFEHPVYGKVPLGLYYTYPFGQTLYSTEEEAVPKIDPVESVREIVQYQWGVGLEKEKLEVEVRKDRPRKVYYEGKYIGMVRPHDGLFVPSIEGARILKERLPFPKGRVVVDDVAREPVSEGKTVFTKFVIDVDPDLRPNQEIIVVDAEDNVVAVGKTVLNTREMEEFASHPAVKVRHGAKDREA